MGKDYEAMENVQRNAQWAIEIRDDQTGGSTTLWKFMTQAEAAGKAKDCARSGKTVSLWSRVSVTRPVVEEVPDALATG